MCILLIGALRPPHIEEYQICKKDPFVFPKKSYIFSVSKTNSVFCYQLVKLERELMMSSFWKLLKFICKKFWRRISYDPLSLYIVKYCNFFHFWGSYKFSLDLKLHLVETSMSWVTRAARDPTANGCRIGWTLFFCEKAHPVGHVFSICMAVTVWP